MRGKTIVDATIPARSREATRVLRELEAERERLPEELRRAGGLPGWLRRRGEPVSSEPLPPPRVEEPTSAGDVVFSWKTVPSAAFYIVEVQCLDCCVLLDPCDPRSIDVKGTSATFPFEGGGSGRWRVRALDVNGFAGGWSEWKEFEHRPNGDRAPE